MKEKDYVVFECESDNNYNYIYDGKTSRFYLLEKRESELLESINYLGNDITLSKRLDNMIKKNLFFSEFKEFEHKNEKELFDELYSSEFDSILMLKVCDQCNLRCDYCVYNDSYKEIRTFGEGKMSFKIAKKSVDFIVGLHKTRIYNGNARDIIVGFYGGEPFLNFELIKQVVEYCETEYSDFNINYMCTTNGTLLTSKVIDFIAKRRFILTFSIDGNSFNHDLNRKFTNGSGTFNRVCKNIAEYKTVSQNPYNTNSALGKFSSLHDYIKFFSESNLFDINTGHYVADILPFGSSYYDDMKFKHKNLDMDRRNSSYNEIFCDYLSNKKLYNDRYQKTIESTVLNSIFRLKYRDMSYNISKTLGTCRPLMKIYIDINGNVDVCEKNNEKYVLFNINEEINHEILLNYVNSFIDSLNDNKCYSCKFRKLCNICYIFYNKDEGVDCDFCKETKKSIFNNLKDYVKCLEKGVA